MEIRNPFTFGEVVSGDDFADRQREMKELAQAILGRTNVIMASPRRYGKTSLILEVFRQVQNKGIQTIYVDLFPAISRARFAEIYAAAISQATRGKLEEAVAFLKEIVPTPKIVIRPEGVPGIEVELGRTRKDIDYLLSSLLDAPQRLAEKRKKLVAVALDEFQEIDNLDGEQMQRELRTKIQHHSRVTYVFAGSRRHLLNRIFADKTRPLYRTGKPFYLGPIPAEDFKDFIRRKFQISKISISDPIADEVLSFTSCHPYYTQQLCHEIWNLLRPESHVETSHVKQAIENVLISQSYAFTTIWESLPPIQRALLRGIAIQGGSKIFSKEFVAKHSLGTPSNVQKAAQYLTERGFLERADGDYVITDAFLREWLRRM
jgi:hypothetical protein